MTTPVKRAESRANGVVPKPKPDVEIGVAAYLPFVTPYKNAWEALRDEDITVRQLQAMRKTDGQARALYRLITLPIRAALNNATFVPEDRVEGGEDEAEFAAQMFTLPASGGGMTVPFSRFIAQMLLAVFDGFTAFELVYQSPTDGPLKGKWTLKKAAMRPSETLTFLLDDRSEFAGLRQQTMYQNRQVDVTIPAAHAIYYAANEEEKPFYGQSYFQSAFFHWDKKFKLYTLAHLAAQRAAVPTRVGKLPKNPNREEKLAFQKGLSDLGVAQWMTMPEEYQVEALKETTGYDFLAIINHHNSQMSKSVLAAFFDKEQGGGDSAKLVDFGQQSDSLFLLMLETIMGEIEEVINQKVIPRFIDWNFASGKYPRFQFGSLSEGQKQSMLDLFKQFAVAGEALTIRPELVHEMEKKVAEEFGLEIDWETIEEQMLVEAEAADMAEELAAQEQAGMIDGVGPNAGPTAGNPDVPADLIPEGFTLSDTGQDPITFDHTDPAVLALTELANDLLTEAGLAADQIAADTLALTRGVPSAGGPKYVRTAAGARVYGVPVGSPITRDIREKLGSQGVKGKVFGGGIRAAGKSKSGGSGRSGGSSAGTGDSRTGREILGGGPGAKPQNPGNVVTDPRHEMPTPSQVLGHPDAPGVQLLDFGDGTVAIRDADGRMSARQRFQIEKFLKLGWQIARTKPGDSAAKTTGQTAGKTAGKGSGPSRNAGRSSTRTTGK